MHVVSQLHCLRRQYDVTGIQDEEDEQGDEDEEEPLQADDSGLLQAGDELSEASGRSLTVQACYLCLGPLFARRNSLDFPACHCIAL